MADSPYDDDPFLDQIFAGLPDFAPSHALPPSFSSPFATSSFPRLGPSFPTTGFGHLLPPLPPFGSWAVTTPSPALSFGAGYGPLRPAHSANDNSSRFAPGFPLISNSAPQPPALPPLLPPQQSFGLPTPAQSTTTPTTHTTFPPLPTFTSSFGNTSLAANRNSDDFYLNQLATGDFSSPSTFPSTFRDAATTRASPSARSSSSRNTVAQPSNNNADAERVVPSSSRIPDEIDNNMPASPPLTNAGEPRMPSRLHQNRRRPAASVSRSAIPSQIMDVDGLTFPTSSFSRPQNVASQSIPNSTSGGSGVARKRKRSEDPFKLEDSPGLYGETINLVDTDEVPAAKKLKKSADEIRLGAFQCVICMDDVTDLTVTHCGHVFCGECLHTALTMDQSKKICPICRQKIDPKPASGKFGVRARGFYDLKLKVAVRKTLGQPTG